MKKTLQSLALIGALTAGGFALAGMASAADPAAEGGAPVACQPGSGPGYGYGPMGFHRGPMGGPRGFGMFGRHFDPNRVYTLDEVKILAEAHLIRLGNPNLKLGKVIEAKDKDAYVVTIVTKDNSLVDSLEIDKHTGMPMRPDWDDRPGRPGTPRRG